MNIFELDKEYSIVCSYESTRYGFRHIAVLHKNGYEVSRTKMCYHNRTWEKFTYQSVLRKMVDQYFNDNANKRLEYIKKLDLGW